MRVPLPTSMVTSSVKAASNATLNVSYVGYVPQNVKVNGRSDITIVLQEDAQVLNDVVVIGYGTMKKSDISGSVATINKEQMERKASPSTWHRLCRVLPPV